MRLWICVFSLLLCLSPAPSLCQQTSPATMPLNVKNLPAAELLKQLATDGGIDLALGAGVQGNVTVYSGPRPVRELLQLIVDLIGAAMYEQSGLVLIVTKEEYEKRFGHPYYDPTVTRWVSLRNTPVVNLSASIRTLLSKQGRTVEDPRSNSVLIIDVPERVTQIAQFIADADQPTVTELVPVRHREPSPLLEGLTSQIPNTLQASAESSTRSILLRGSRQEIDLARTLIGMLDRPVDLSSATYQLRYARADSIQEWVSSQLSPGVGSVFAHPHTSQLDVTDFPEVLDRIEKRLLTLDQPPRQVLIEARILQLSLNKEVRTGINWDALQEALNVSGTFGTLASNSSGVRTTVGDLTSRDYEIVLEALSTFGETELLSSPRIVVPDGRSGRILVGTQEPYITTDTRETPAGTVDRFEKVTIVDTGVSLEVTARVHDDLRVTMTLKPEVSSVTEFRQNVPVIETSLADSRVTVEDGKTVILGGLNRRESRDERSGVPILKDIPLLRYLFSSTRTVEARTELVILITPHILVGTEPVSEWISKRALELQETP